MVRPLMLFVRLLALVLALTSLLALAVATIESSEPSLSRILTERWDCIQHVSVPCQPGDQSTLHLIDRRSGQCDTVVLPSGGRWPGLSISPWSNLADGIEAVGIHASPRTQGGFLGLVRIRLPEGLVTDHVPIDVPPTSRPCWVPGHPDSIIFTAGDGRLYRHDFKRAEGHQNGLEADPDEDEKPAEQGPGQGQGQTSAPRPFVWKCPLPSDKTYYLTDPTWPVHPRLCRLILAVLFGTPRTSGNSPSGKDCRLWWLRVGVDGISIEASGPLIETDSDDWTIKREIKRFPTVMVDASGETHLAYVAHRPGSTSGSIQIVRLQLDPDSGRPEIVAGTRRLIARDCMTVPPVFSADGTTVFGIASATGQLMRYQAGPTGPKPGPIAARQGEIK